VDDDPQFCKTLGDILRARGFAVAEVTHPAGLTNKLGPDGQVVVLDMKFNSTSGLAILKEIREQYPRVPVILVTGYREEMAQAIEAALKVNAYACLYKPFQIEEFLQVLTEIHHRELGKVLGQPARKRR
jgi:DNA-binding NtrC family response regulator